MTDTRQVRRDQPYWWVAAPPVSLDGQTLPLTADVVIVGAGYAGLAAALELARAGRDVVVIDKQAPGEGASTRNGGITSGNLRPSHANLARRFGKDRADAIILEAKAARDDLYRFIAEKEIDCDFKLVGRFAGAMSARQYEALARESDYLSKNLGIEAHAVAPADMHRHIATDIYCGGSVRMDIGGLHPGKLHAQMLRLALATGVRVIGHTAVTEVQKSTQGFAVGTDRGAVRARDVIIATNGYTDPLDRWLQRRIVPVRSRIIVTEALAPGLLDRLLPTRMMISDKRKLSYYFRPTPDGTRLLFGGRDGTFAGDPSWPTDHLHREMTRIFPDLQGIGLAHSWYGYVAMNRDMMPRVFQREGIHYATGCCGSGVVWLRWAGRKVAEKILGTSTTSALDFGPPKSIPLFRGKAWFMPAVFAVMKIQDRMARR